VRRSKQITRVARRIARTTGGFTGGQLGDFEQVGRHTFISLLQNGLQPDHTLLDLGCGALRLGYWLIRYLNPDRYCGLDPNLDYVLAGLVHAIGPEMEALKRPRFLHTSDFDFSRFNVTFDFVVARSIFSHAPPKLVRRAMTSFRENSSEDAIMLASYRLSEDEVQDESSRIKQGSRWSRNHYSLAYMQELAKERGLFADNFGAPFHNQAWLRLSRRELPVQASVPQVDELDTNLDTSIDAQVAALRLLVSEMRRGEPAPEHREDVRKSA
jgi:hypothetical protein